MRDITFMPDDYIVKHVKSNNICEKNYNDDVVYVVDTKCVPLIHCRECSHWQNKHLCNQWSRFGTIETEADDFCSRGIALTEREKAYREGYEDGARDALADVNESLERSLHEQIKLMNCEG